MSSQAVDLYGAEALAEVTSYLERVKAKSRDPIITSDEIRRTIQTHFGLNHVASRYLANHVTNALRDHGWLVAWDVRVLSDRTVIEYRVNLTPTSALCA